MTLDQYQLCPCGSGKKTKFCCSKDILNDLDRIDQMVKGEQRLAAIEKIDTLLAKYPDHTSVLTRLLTIKAEVQLALKEYANARETSNRLLQVNPNDPSALALPAILDIVEGQSILKAVDDLQSAFAAVGESVTARVYEAVMLVAMSLLKSGLPVAAKGHLQLALALSDAKDERCTSALMQLNHSRQIPLLLREPLDLENPPEDVTWQIEFTAAMQDVFRGRWREGAQKLSEMSNRILDAPAILKNLGVLSAWLGRNDHAVKALRSYAQIRDLPLDSRVHAEALAQLLDPDMQKQMVPVIGVEAEIKDIDPLMEKFLSSTNLRQLPNNDQPESSEPPPRAIFELLDQPMPASGKELTLEQIPRSLATLAVFGKQTNREARLQIQFVEVPGEDSPIGAIQSIAGDALGELQGDPQPISQLPRISAAVFGTLRIPDDAEVDARRDLVNEARRVGLLERWGTMPSPLYDGKSPQEVVKDGSDKVPLLAEILVLDLAAQEGNWDLDLNEVRSKLGVAEREAIDADGCDIDRLPVHDFARLDASKLSDDQLLVAYRRSYSVMAVHPLRDMAKEVISRESLNDKIDKVEAYDILSDVATNTDDALMYLEKARKLAKADGESPAQWLIDELEIRLLRGEVEQFTQLLKEIQTRYMKEPGVGPSLLQVLSRYGLVTPDGRVMMPGKRETAEAADQQQAEASSGAGVWTPEAGENPAASSSTQAPPEEPKQESKLWVPGMD